MTKFLKVNKIENFTSWETINWEIVDETLTNLYLLIFNAKQKKDLENLYHWQEILFYSKANILFSINSVTDFCFTKNIYNLDKLLIRNNLQKWNLYLSLSRFKPKDWIVLLKSNTNSRFSSIFSLKGLIIQNMLINTLKPEWESVFSLYTIKLSSFKNALSYLYLLYSHDVNKNWIVTIDLIFCFNQMAKYFSNELFKFSPFVQIINVLIKNEMKNFLKILSLNLGEISIRSFLEKKTIFPFLLDIFLYKFEKSLLLKLMLFENLSLFQYSNKLFVLSKSKINCEKVQFYIDNFFMKNNKFKTKPLIKIENLKDGVVFLDFKLKIIMRFNHLKFVVTPNYIMLQNLKQRLRKIWFKFMGKTASMIISKINPIIYSWVKYYQPFLSNEIIAELDLFLAARSWKFAKRLHPSKGANWLYNKYFVSITGLIYEKRFLGFLKKGSRLYLLKFKDIKVLPCFSQNEELLVFFYLKKLTVNVKTSFTGFKITKFYFICPLCLKNIDEKDFSFLYFFKFYSTSVRQKVYLKSFIIHDLCQLKYYLLNLKFSTLFFKFRIWKLKNNLINN